MYNIQQYATQRNAVEGIIWKWWLQGIYGLLTHFHVYTKFKMANKNNIERIIQMILYQLTFNQLR